MPNTSKGTIHNRRDRVCAQLHFNISKEIGVKLDKEPWYDYLP